MRLAPLLIVLAAASPAFAQAESKPQEKPPEKPAKPPEESPVTVTYKDGLNFKSADGVCDLHLGGLVIENYRSTLSRSDTPGGRGSPDSFYNREVSLQLLGKVSRDFSVKIETNFPSGATNASSVLDAWMGWTRWPELSIKFGNCKVPFSQEETTTFRWTDFSEKSVLNRLAPGRDPGVSVFGKLFDGVLGYETAIVNGNGSNVFDTNDEKDVAARLRFSPFAGAADESPLKGLRVGVAGTLGNLPKNSAITGINIVTTELQTTVFSATGGVLDGWRSRIGLELAWLVGPFGLRAELVERTDDVDVAGSNDLNIRTRAWSVAATYFITGEKKPLENRGVPTDPFDPGTGHWGAVELTARLASIQIDERVFERGIAVAAGNATHATVFTAGANWWLLRNVRLTPNVVYEMYGDKLAFGLDTKDALIGVVVRMQVDF